MFMLRCDIIAAYGLNGNSSNPAEAPAAILGVETLAKVHDLAVTIAQGFGVCAPWPSEDVLLITCYASADRLGDVKAFARDIRVAYSQDAVTFATSEVNFNLLED